MEIKFKTWWLLLAAGVILVCAGIFSLLYPLQAFLNAVGYTGSILLVNAVLLLLLGYTHSYKRERYWLIIESIVDMLFGATLLFNPLLTFIILPLVIGNWMFVVGIVKILAAWSLRKHIRQWLYILVTGVVVIAFGILISYNPIGKASGSITLLGLFCLVLGLLNVFDALRFKKEPAALNMMF